jgi:hypothetical protein
LTLGILERETTMTSFVHTQFPTEHPGVVRAESVAAAAGHLGRRFGKRFDTTKSLAAMLLAALVAAMVVVADQLIDTWADGHLMAAWVALWAVAFTALALLAPTAKRAAAGLSTGLKAWSERSAQARSEAQYWESAMADPRIMAEIQCAKLRAEEAEIDKLDAAEPTAGLARLDAMMSPSQHYLRYM